MGALEWGPAPDLRIRTGPRAGITKVSKYAFPDLRFAFISIMCAAHLRSTTIRIDTPPDESGGFSCLAWAVSVVVTPPPP